MKRFTLAAALLLVLTCVACGGDDASSTAGPTAPPSGPNGKTLTSPTSCGMLVSSGSFVLANALTDAVRPCLVIAADNVQLDCGHHSISNGVSMIGRTNVTISNCTVGHFGISVQSGTRVVVDHNVIGPGGYITLGRGSQNQVTRNTIDGGYHGHDTTGEGTDAVPGEGADDGIVLSNEANDLVDGNSIVNVFDAGIEGVNEVTNTVITNNVISDAVLAGIGAYRCTRWVGNTITGNTVTRSQFLIYVLYLVNANCSQPLADRAFMDNTITSNALRGQLGTLGARIDLSTPSLAVVSNNLIQGNDFVLPVRLLPIAGFINGGGNICQTGGTFEC